MTNTLDAEELAEVERQLNSYVEQGFLEYYLPTDPPGIEFVVGFSGQLVKLYPDTVRAFLMGATMFAHGMLAEQRKAWLRI